MRTAHLSIVIAAAVTAAAARAVPPPTTRPHSTAGTYYTFDLTPVPPPVPTLRYRLRPAVAEQTHDNAALLYDRAGLLYTAEVQDLCGTASMAYASPEADSSADWPTFDKAMTALTPRAADLYAALDHAARCDRCQWLDPTPADAAKPPSPELRLMGTFSFLSEARATHALRQGHIGEAMVAVRTLYAISRHAAADERFPVIGYSYVVLADEQAAKLMTRPDCPNLYWALTDLSGTRPNFADAVRQERANTEAAVPLLAKSRVGGITAADWPACLQQARTYATAGDPHPKLSPVVTDAEAANVLDRTRDNAVAFYARTRHLTPAQAEAADRRLVAAVYVIEGFAAAEDEREKLAGLPLPEAIGRSVRFRNHLRGLRLESAAVLFWGDSYTPAGSLRTYALVSRGLPALTAVEAVRSYAAAHDGRLPEQLKDITDTPAPVDPTTGRPFLWQVRDGVGTLFSPDPFDATHIPIEFTIRIRHGGTR